VEKGSLKLFLNKRAKRYLGKTICQPLTGWPGKCKPKDNPQTRQMVLPELPCANSQGVCINYLDVKMANANLGRVRYHGNIHPLFPVYQA
jgi:hypothetical protein